MGDHCQRYCDLTVESAPHEDLHSINHELQNCGFQTLASGDDFERSLTCTMCGVKLTYQDRAKAMWLLKRHSSENSHQVKAGWYLDASNNVLDSKPKGKSNLVKSGEQLHAMAWGKQGKLIFSMNPSNETAIWAHLENITWKQHQLMLVNVLERGKWEGNWEQCFLRLIFISGELRRLIGLVSKSERVQCDVSHVLSFPGAATTRNASLRLWHWHSHYSFWERFKDFNCLRMDTNFVFEFSNLICRDLAYR